MTRDEEVRKAIDTIIPISPSNNGRTYEQAMMATGFESGVKWADANPKSQWISVENDLPCNHSEHKYHEKASSTKDVLIRRADNSYSIDCMMVRDKEWDWVLSSLIGIYPTHWIPIPELPKE